MRKYRGGAHFMRCCVVRSISYVEVSVRSFLRSFVPSFLRSFVPSFLRSFVPSFLRSSLSAFLRCFLFPSFLPSFAFFRSSSVSQTGLTRMMTDGLTDCQRNITTNEGEKGDGERIPHLNQSIDRLGPRRCALLFVCALARSSDSETVDA